MGYAGSRMKIDWWTILLYGLLVGFGWLNIYSASLREPAEGLFNMTQIYGKQLLWIMLSFGLIIFVLALDTKFYERFSSLIYIAALMSLLGLFVFGQTINGANSWYHFGTFSLQPS